MEGVNLKYNVTAEVLTPLSVGQGSEKDWVEGIDYVVKNDMMYHLDLSKMYAAGIDMEHVANLFQKQDTEGVHLLIGEKLEQVSDFKMPMTCHSSNPIKTFFRNQLTNRPVLPGSSLKGAIRSVLFTYLRDNERDNASVFGSMKDGSDFNRTTAYIATTKIIITIIISSDFQVFFNACRIFFIVFRFVYNSVFNSFPICIYSEILSIWS